VSSATGGGYDIPVGTLLVFVNVWAIGRDPAVGVVWGSAAEFHVERYVSNSVELEVLPFESDRNGQ
jgi:cytochrome P450